MLAIAAELGYSRDGVRAPPRDGRRLRRPLLQPAGGGRRSAATRRSPPAVALAERDGAGRSSSTRRRARCRSTRATDTAGVTATLTSVAPHVEDAPRRARSTPRSHALALGPGELDPALPPRIAYAGARHLILAAATRERLADLDYDFERAQARDARARPDDRRPRLARGRDARSTRATRSRSAASSRTRRPAPRPPRSAPTCASSGSSTPPATVTIHQGDDMGRPSLLTIDIAPEGGDPRDRARGVAHSVLRPSARITRHSGGRLTAVTASTTAAPTPTSAATARPVDRQPAR